jgi:hypothetical protein
LCFRNTMSLRSRREAILAFGAALLTFRLAGLLLGRWRARRQPYLLAWERGARCLRARGRRDRSGAAAGWNDAASAAYLPLRRPCSPPRSSGRLAAAGRRPHRRGRSPSSTLGSRSGSRWPCRSSRRSAGRRSPRRRSTWRSSPRGSSRSSATSPARSPLDVVAIRGFRRRPIGNALLLAGFATAAVGSALAGLGTAETAAFIAAGAGLFVCGNRFGTLTVLTFCKQDNC